VQLTPDVDRPLVTVNTFWEGASPQEIEREIVDRQEEKLKGVRNLKKMTSTSQENNASVTLEFYVGTDTNAALQEVSEKLRQVTGYPEDVDEPTIESTGAEMANTIAWIIFHGAPGEDVSGLKDFVEDDVKPILERAQGIASVDVYGGREREVRVTIDPYRLAARGLNLRDLSVALRGQNTNISAGTIAQGKRDFTYRTVGQYEQVDQVENTVIAYRDGGPVFVRDVAKVENTFKKQYSFVKSRGEFVLALPARKETGANVMSAMANLKKQIQYCNESILRPTGRKLELTQVYDETTYIKSAINLVIQNLWVGGALTIIVLLLFLRSLSATAIVAFSIPISVVSTFLAVSVLGRNLNVVMLAGMAFAVGMVVDNAIVVLENIYRHRQMGKSMGQASLEGAREVWGAVLASTLTTMAVFLPVIFIEEEAGQLFKDIAVAISCAVGLSLAVSLTVIPTLSARMLRVSRRLAEAGDHTGHTAAFVGRMVHFINRRWSTRLALIAALVLTSVYGSRKLMPATDYLPAGNRNLVFGFVITPPGYSIDSFKTIAAAIERGTPEDPIGLDQYWNAPLNSPEEKALPPVPMQIGVGKKTETRVVPAPPIDNFFYVSFGGGSFMGATSKREEIVRPLINIMSTAGQRIPGAMTFFSQMSLFGRDAGGNSILLEVRSDELAEVTAAAKGLMPRVMQRFGYPRPDPTNFDLGRPEVRIRPDREKAANLGLTVQDVGFTVAACVDGAYVGSFYDRGDEIDLKLHIKGTEGASVQELSTIPIYTPTGKVVPVSSSLKITSTTAPQQINHIEEMPAVTLTVQPPEGMALETAMGILQNEIIDPMRQSGQIPQSVITTLAGTADKLVQTREALFGAWRGTSWQPDPKTGMRPLVASLTNLFTSRGFLALLITYLLMAALFESFLWPFVIIFTVPLATIGGFAALRIVHEASLLNPVGPIQQLDVLTMLGFVILIGIVVNNGILVVHQALNNHRDYGLAWPEAISESVRTRVRPIFMTAFTSIGGMLPLVVWPGAGSELYRGLGSVVVGGLFVATIFTLLLVPAVMSASVDALDALARLLRGRAVAGARQPEAGPIAPLPEPRPSDRADVKPYAPAPGAARPASATGGTQS